MVYNPNIHHRRSIRLKNYDYSQPGTYFITICTDNHFHYFGSIYNNSNDENIRKLNEGGKIAEQCWIDIPKHYPNVQLDVYVVMPNHVHGILIINESVGGSRGTKFCAPNRHTAPIRRGTKFCAPNRHTAPIRRGTKFCAPTEYTAPTSKIPIKTKQIPTYYSCINRFNCPWL